MNIYVAGKWQEKLQVRKVQDYLRSKGHEITFDWTQQKSTMNILELSAQATNDFVGIMDSTVLVAVLTNENQYLSGSPNRYVEIGIALGLGKRVMIIGKPRKDFLFSSFVQVFESMEDLPL